MRPLALSFCTSPTCRVTGILKTSGPSSRKVQKVSRPGPQSTTKVVSFASGGAKGEVGQPCADCALRLFAAGTDPLRHLPGSPGCGSRIFSVTGALPCRGSEPGFCEGELASTPG